MSEQDDVFTREEREIARSRVIEIEMGVADWPAVVHRLMHAVNHVPLKSITIEPLKVVAIVRLRDDRPHDAQIRGFYNTMLGY
jgi:hypothetical protein